MLLEEKAINQEVAKNLTYAQLFEYDVEMAEQREAVTRSLDRDITLMDGALFDRWPSTELGDVLSV